MSDRSEPLVNHSNQGEEAGLAPDQPVASAEFDYLGRGEFASRLAKQLVEYENDQCLVVAFYAPWGAGKSSLLNLLSNEFERSVEDSTRLPILIKFNPWNFSGLHSLISMFFRELETAIGSSEPKRSKNIQKSLQALSIILAAGELSPVGGSSFGAGSRLVKWVSDVMQKKSESLETIKNRINRELRRLDRRIFILIDDVDRLDQESMRYMFRLIRLNADFDSVTYVLAFDRNVVEFVLAMEQGVSGHEYLEKIVQVGFDIPPAEPSKLKQMFLKRMESIGFSPLSNDENSIRWIELEGVGFYKMIRTPRDVVRYANGLVVNGGIVKDEVNPVDFAVLEAIRTFAPKLYDFIRENREIVLGSPGPARVEAVVAQAFNQGGHHDDYQRDLRDRMEKVLSQCNVELKDTLREICKQLFPEIGVLYGNSSYGAMLRKEEWRRAKRICVTEFFPRYFYLRPSEQEVAQAEFENIVTNGNGHAARVTQMGELIDSGKIDNFLDRLGDSHTEVPESYIQPTVSALFDLGDRMTTGLGLENQLLRVSRVVYKLLLRLEESTRLSILHKVSKETVSLGMVVYFARLWYQPSRPELKLIDEKGWEEIRKLLVDRIRDAAKDMTLASSPHLGILLYRWREWGSMEEAREFVGRLVESDDGVLVFLQGMMAPKSTSVGEYGYAARQGWHISAEAVSEFVSLEILNESVQRVKTGRGDDISFLEQAAIEAFLDSMTSTEMDVAGWA